MNFGCMYCIIFQTHCSNTFSFAPATTAVSLTKPGQITNSSTNGNGFFFGDFSNDFKIHSDYRLLLHPVYGRYQSLHYKIHVRFRIFPSQAKPQGAISTLGIVTKPKNNV